MTIRAALGGNEIRGRTDRYSNPIGLRFYGVFVVVVVPAVLALGILFGVVEYWGWRVALALETMTVVMVLWAESLFWFTSIEVRPGRVILRAPLWVTTVDAVRVDHLEVSGPLQSLTPRWSWWKPDTQFKIRLRGGRIVNVSGMPDGLKLRIANALRPAEFPVPEDE